MEHRRFQTRAVIGKQGEFVFPVRCAEQCGFPRHHRFWPSRSRASRQGKCCEIPQEEERVGRRINYVTFGASALGGQARRRSGVCITEYSIQASLHKRARWAVELCHGQGQGTGDHP